MRRKSSMKNYLRKAAVLLCTLALVVSSFGCSKETTNNESSSTQTQGSSKDYIYSLAEMNIDGLDLTQNYHRMDKVGDRFFLIGISYDSEGEKSTFRVSSFLEDGTGLYESSIELPANEYFNSYAFDEEGNAYVVYNSYNYDSNDYYDNYYLIKYDSSFNEVWRTPLHESSAEDGEYFYAGNVKYSKNDGLFLMGSLGIVLYDSESGELVKQVTPYDTCASWNEFFVGNDGNYFVSVYEDSANKVYAFDKITKVV